MGSNFVFTMIGSKCFRKFQLSSRIANSYDAEPPGLEGDPLSIVLPMGWVMLGVFLGSAFLHYMYCRTAASNARLELEGRPMLEIGNGATNAHRQSSIKDRE